MRGLKVGGRVRRGRQRRAADRRARGREGRAARRGRGRRAVPRSSSAESGIEGQFFQPSVLVGVTADDGDELRGDVRPGRRDRALLDRGRGDPDRERHAVRPRRVLLLAGPRPRHARRRGARVRDRRHQHRAHLDRGRAVRRREGVGDRAARARPTGSTSGSSCKYWAIGGIGGASSDRRAARLPRVHGQAPRARAALRGRRGSRIQQEYLGGFVGAFTTDDRRALHLHARSGATTSFADREERRARLPGGRALDRVPRAGSSR